MSKLSEWEFQAQFAVVREQSDLTDARETGIAAAILQSTSDRFEDAHGRIDDALLKGLGLLAEGQDLDDVVAQWAPDFEPRRDASPAQGAVLELVRDGTSGTETVPAGSVFATRAGRRVVLSADLQILDGWSVYPAPGQSRGYVTASLTGPGGDLDPGVLSQVIQAPQSVIGCSNPIALTGGRNRETDPELRKRFLDYLAGGITRLPERGLVALAKAFADRGVRHATVWVDPSRPYAELRIDNGRGFVGLTQPARTVTGIVPVQGQLDFYCDGPVVDDEVRLRVNGVPVSPVQWTLIHERGRAWLDESADFWQPGDEWEVSGHDVYTGVIAEMQRVVEGVQAWSERQFGYRSTAARVRVVPVRLEYVEYDLLVVYQAGADRDLVDETIRNVILAFHDDLESDSPLLMLRIKGQLDRVDGVENIHLRDRDDPAVEMGDVYATPGYKLGTLPGLIKINRT